MAFQKDIFLDLDFPILSSSWFLFAPTCLSFLDSIRCGFINSTSNIQKQGKRKEIVIVKQLKRWKIINKIFTLFCRLFGVSSSGVKALVQQICVNLWQLMIHRNSFHAFVYLWRSKAFELIFCLILKTFCWVDFYDGI